MNWTNLIAIIEERVYRIGGFFVLHVLDDPAWLALMFC